jgi:chemotaxis protein histidine kinase CheA
MSASTADAGDDEIVEIFAEEAGEVLEHIDRQLAVLRGRPTDRNALGEIRRAFHTLKGSGRMVKALDLGELAWKIENMLNRVIEGKVPIGEPLMAAVAASRALMPRLLDAFKDGRQPDMEDELEALMGQADAIASGQAPVAAAPRLAPAADLVGAQARLNELYRRLERSTQRADEALHRSEMALQQARGLAARIEAAATEAQERPTRAELHPLFERVNALTREVLELRQQSRAPNPEAPPHPRELQQLFDQRIRERLAPGERSRVEMERQIEDARRNVASARRLALWALGLGLGLTIGALATLVAIWPTL